MKRIGSLMALVNIFLASCSCPDHIKVNGTLDINLYQWEKRAIVSEQTQEAYSYLMLPSKKEAAPTLILIHGFNLNAFSFINCYELAEEFTVIAWQIPDQSIFYHGDYHDFAKAFKDFVSALGINQFVLGGVSLGGQIAVDYYQIKDEVEITALLQISTFIQNGSDELRAYRQKIFSMLYKRSDKWIVCFIKRNALDAKKKSEFDPQHDVFSIFQIKHTLYYRQVIEALYDFEDSSLADTITCPTFVVIGSEDEQISLEDAKVTLEWIPHADFEVIPGSKHDGIFSHGELFTEKILAWWRSQSDS